MSQRPFEIDPLFRGLTTLPGLGPRNGKLVEKLVEGPRVADLLFHGPADFIDRRFTCPLSQAPNGKMLTTQVRVEKHYQNERKSLPYRVKCTDGSGTVMLVFFHAKKGWIEKLLPLGSERVISGKIEYFQGQIQMVHPEVVKPQERESLEAVEPIYPLTAGITNKVLRKAIKSALNYVPKLPEWIDEAHKKRENWPDWDDAVRSLHTPESAKDLEPTSKVRMRLAYDELLANQLTLALVRDRRRKINGRSFISTGDLRKKIEAVLPFNLTGAQTRCLAEIDKDMIAKARMLRLLQGDVGSGKTIVAVLAMMNAVENGAQAAIIAPTEILARQHEKSLRPWLEAAGVRFVTLTGRDKGKTREVMLKQIKDGTAQVILGTHSIFQSDVEYHDLGIAVIDEQHRFGVHQRMELSTKGKGTDILVMTATPIPRSLALTAYGDLEISKLDEKPPGRKPVETMLFSQEKLDDLVAALKRKIAEGVRIYWVCPLVEESDVLDLAAAEERYDILKAQFGERIGLVHGRMKPTEKDEVMTAFAGGNLDILVATTVIEVGVDVPEATIMVIEHAERFGLSQLHQLRGRVGRSAEQSYCFLVYSGPLGEIAKERLSIMRETEDGFLIAEKDLELRGSGDILGTKQSGVTDFALADMMVHGELLATARDDAKLIISKSPELDTRRGVSLKTLLYLFERDQAIRYFRGG